MPHGPLYHRHRTAPSERRIGTWYNIRVILHGNRFECYVNSELIHSAVAQLVVSTTAKYPRLFAHVRRPQPQIQVRQTCIRGNPGERPWRASLAGGGEPGAGDRKFGAWRRPGQPRSFVLTFMSAGARGIGPGGNGVALGFVAETGRGSDLPGLKAGRCASARLARRLGLRLREPSSPMRRVAPPVVADFDATPVSANEVEPVDVAVMIGWDTGQVVVRFGGGLPGFFDSAAVAQDDQASGIGEVSVQGFDGEGVQVPGFDPSVSGLGVGKKGVLGECPNLELLQADAVDCP